MYEDKVYRHSEAVDSWILACPNDGCGNSELRWKLLVVRGAHIVAALPSTTTLTVRVRYPEGGISVHHVRTPYPYKVTHASKYGIGPSQARLRMPICHPTSATVHTSRPRRKPGSRQGGTLITQRDVQLYISTLISEIYSESFGLNRIKYAQVTDGTSRNLRRRAKKTRPRYDGAKQKTIGKSHEGGCALR
ncbi:hypothetical protein Trydic_g21504 [Trypoxylus dichotomus]